jgi:hypothetical protein
MFDNKFKKNDPLSDSVKKVMMENEVRRQAEASLNEELGIDSRKALPHEYHSHYDAMLADRINEALVGNQHKIDANKNGRVDDQDFKLLKKGVRPVAEDQVNTAGKSNAEPKTNASAPQKTTTLPPYQDKSTGINLGGMTVAKKNMQEASYSAKAGRAGKDLGKPGKNFAKIAKSAAKRYGSKESGERVAGAILKKIRGKLEEANLNEAGAPNPAVVMAAQKAQRGNVQTARMAGREASVTNAPAAAPVSSMSARDPRTSNAISSQMRQAAARPTAQAAVPAAPQPNMAAARLAANPVAAPKPVAAPVAAPSISSESGVATPGVVDRKSGGR